MVVVREAAPAKRNWTTLLSIKLILESKDDFVRAVIFFHRCRVLFLDFADAGCLILVGERTHDNPRALVPSAYPPYSFFK